MAYIFDVNQATDADGIVSMFRLKTLLKLAGWTVMSSSDGLTYNASGDQITTSATGAGGLRNAKAWFRIRQPGTNAREFVIQLPAAASANVWRIKYSGGPGTGFVGGAPAILQVPSATDEIVTHGSGTDAAPVGASAMASTTNLRFNCVAGGAAEGYPFYFFAVAAAGTSCSYAGYFESMDPTSVQAGDVDPYVMYWPTASSTLLSLSDLCSATVGTGTMGWIAKGLAAAGWKNIGASEYRGTGGTSYPGAVGSNAYTTKDDLMPIPYIRSSGASGGTPYGWKGVGRMVKWLGNSRASFDTLSVATPKDYVALFGSTSVAAVVAFPWNGTDVLL